MNKRKSSVLSILVLCMMVFACSKNDPEVIGVSDDVAFDFNFQVFETDRNRVVIRDYPKIYEVYLKPTTTKGVASRLELTVTAGFQADFIIRVFDSNGEIKNSIGSPVVAKSGDKIFIPFKQIKNDRFYVEFTYLGVEYIDSNLKFNILFNAVNKEILREVFIV